MKAEIRKSKGGPNRVRIYNPERAAPGELTDKEKEIVRAARDGVQQERVAYSLKHYEYFAPFQYPNCRCELGRVGTGTGPHPEGMELDIPPFGAVTIEETEPIIAVDVLGSPCTAPGTVLLYGEPLEWRFGRAGVRYKVNNLWGEHLYGWGVSHHWDTGSRHAGMVSAHFEIPDCSKITVMGYGQLDLHVGPPGEGISPEDQFEEIIQTATGERWMNDAHFNIYAVRVGVRVREAP